jgi:hypothetical protein
MIHMILLFVLNVAFGATYSLSTTFEVPAAPISGWTADIGQAKNVGTIKTQYQPISDRSVTSSWSYLKCKLVDHNIVLVFHSTVSGFPTSVPSSATCSDTYNGDTYNVTVTLSQSSDTSLYTNLTWSSFSSGWDVDLASGIEFWDSQELPSNKTYVEESMVMRNSSNTNWAHTFCVVGKPFGGSKQFLQMYVKGDAAENTSGNYGCWIKETGQNQSYSLVPVKLDRI